MAKKEQERKLTPAEEKRKIRFDEISAELEEQGYRKTQLTIGLVSANLILVLIGIPFLILSMFLFFHINGTVDLSFGAVKTLSLIAVMIVLTVIHELIHGAAWSLFCEMKTTSYCPPRQPEANSAPEANCPSRTRA